MALSERSRNDIFRFFSATDMREETVDDMLAQFSTPDVDQLVTKDFLRSELALSHMNLRNEFNERLSAELGALRVEMRQQLHWMIGSMFTVFAALVAVMVALD